MPLTLLTTVMLTVTLTLLVERLPGELSSLPSAEKPRSESVQDGVATPSKKQAEAARAGQTRASTGAPERQGKQAAATRRKPRTRCFARFKIRRRAGAGGPFCGRQG